MDIKPFISELISKCVLLLYKQYMVCLKMRLQDYPNLHALTNNK
jgi:hypothetical protein